MRLKRFIPVLLVKDGLLVRSQAFKTHQAIGDPIPTIKRLSDWNVDEIVLLNIGSNDIVDSRRDDKWHNLGQGLFTDLVKETSKSCFCPLSVGGGICNIEQFADLFESGADKCIVNTACFTNPGLIRTATERYGSQAIVASIDTISDDSGDPVIAINRGTHVIDMPLIEAIDHCRGLGVGELLISSITNDGSAQGYSNTILESIEGINDISIIINSGASTSQHFASAFQHESISACAASNVFYFTELSYPNFKRELLEEHNISLRQFDFSSSMLTREPSYADDQKASLLSKSEPSQYFNPIKYDGSNQVAIKHCTRCLYSSLSAAPMQFDKDGICMGCRTSDIKIARDQNYYSRLQDQLSHIINKSLANSTSRKYDCIISVSGGKDSYYQTHYVTKILGLKALLVTYNGNNYTQTGWRNLWNMRHVFDCDHLVVSPSVSTLKKLNKIAFVVMGDMNWHAHVGIFTTAPRIAVQQNIPLIFWGEHGYTDLSGQFSMTDFPEMNYRERLEHAARGFDWPFFTGIDSLTEEDMELWKYPSDKELFDLRLKQIYLGHYIPWESNDHLSLVVDQYGFEVSKEPFDRTYRTGSNLDDMHENGIHDYLKYIKFGYGRCTDHASKDIRAGILSRSEAIERANAMDPVKPKDLQRWLSYVDMSEAEFDRIADHFRDSRVWKWTSSAGWTKSPLTS